MIRKHVVILAIVGLSACTSDTVAPTSTPTGPLPAPIPLLHVMSTTVTTCANGGCSFAGQIQNVGDACAANVQGETAANINSFTPKATVAPLAYVPWTTGNIQPSASASFSGCCIDQNVINQPAGVAQSAIVSYSICK